MLNTRRGGEKAKELNPIPLINHVRGWRWRGGGGERWGRQRGSERGREGRTKRQRESEREALRERECGPQAFTQIRTVAHKLVETFTAWYCSRWFHYEWLL